MRLTKKVFSKLENGDYQSEIGNIYNGTALENAINEYMKREPKLGALSDGECHSVPFVSITNASHIVKYIHFCPDSIYVTIETLNNVNGWLLNDLIKHIDVRIIVSGTQIENEGSTIKVNDIFSFNIDQPIIKIDKR